MIDLLLAATIYVTPVEQVSARSMNVAAARAARDIPDHLEDFQACVADRESSGRWNAQNPVSSAQGRYQFIDSQWREGGAWNVWKRLVRHGYDRAAAKIVRQKLMATPIKRWKPVFQDILFAEVVTSGEGMGWRHWYLAGSKCNRMIT